MPSFTPSSKIQGTISPALEQYVEAIAELLLQDKVCSVSDIASRVQVSRPAASRMIRELSEQDIVLHKLYGYVDLTPKGHSIAKNLAKRHEVLFAFLTDVLNFDEEWSDQEACHLEHHVNDKLIRRLEALNKTLRIPHLEKRTRKG